MVKLLKMNCCCKVELKWEMILEIMREQMLALTR
jgi:hypothetical protein